MRMVQEHSEDYPPSCGAIQPIASKIGCVPTGGLVGQFWVEINSGGIELSWSRMYLSLSSSSSKVRTSTSLDALRNASKLAD